MSYATQDLMTLGFDNMVLLLSAYSNPIETIEHARRQGYRVTDFMVTPLPFGYYSSEPKACPVGDIGGCSIQVVAPWAWGRSIMVCLIFAWA